MAQRISRAKAKIKAAEAAGEDVAAVRTKLANEYTYNVASPFLAAERGELLEIPIEIAVSGEIKHLVDLLSRLDAAQKLLTVQDLRVRVVNVSQPKELLATLTVSGFLLPGKAKT